MGKSGQKIQTASYKILSSGDVLQSSMVDDPVYSTVNDPVLCI